MSSAAYCKVVFLIFLNKVILPFQMCHLYPYKNVKLLWKFFYINICGFISRDKFLYETGVLDNSYLRFTVQLPTSDSTEITAEGPKVTLKGPVPLDAPQWKNRFVLNASTLLYLIILLISTFYLQQFLRYQGRPKITLGGPVPPVRPLAENFLYPNRVIKNI